MISQNFLQALEFKIGPVFIGESLIASIILAFIIACAAWLTLRRFRSSPSRLQTTVEGIYLTFYNAVNEAMGDHTEQVLPFIGTLWIFIFFANILGLVPGFSAPTSDLSITASLAFLVYASVHWFGIRIEGWRSYFKHYFSPSPLLFPFHIISELSRTLALAIRLFGNVMSLEIAAALVLMVAGFLVPVPLLMLHVVEAVIQAYLFGMLALIYIAGALQSQDLRREKKGISL